MTFTISFQFKDVSFDLEIKPFDHPAVEDWIGNFVGKPTSYHANLQDWNLIRAWQPASINRYLDHLRDSLGQLANFGMQFQEKIPSSSLHLNRYFLNQCHRFFTERQKDVNDDLFQHLSIRYGRDYKQTVNGVLSEINRLVHDLELFMPPARSAGFKSFEEVHIEYDSIQNQWNNSQWWTMKPAWRSLHTKVDQHFDVILTSEILGKTVLKSYLDDDNPHHWDTSGHYYSLGGLQIQFVPGRRKVYQSQDFQDWFGHPTDGLQCDYPIGNVVDREQLKELHTLLDQSRDHALTVPVSYRHN